MKDVLLISYIKNQKPQCNKELADLAKRDISTVQRKLNILKNDGLIEIKDRTKNLKVLVFNFDKLEITI